MNLIRSASTTSALALTRFLHPVEVAFFWGALAHASRDERRQDAFTARCCKLIQTTRHAKPTANYKPTLNKHFLKL